jgi:hypothetical protein
LTVFLQRVQALPFVDRIEGNLARAAVDLLPFGLGWDVVAEVLTSDACDRKRKDALAVVAAVARSVG